MLRATTVPGSDYINASFVDVRLHYIVMYPLGITNVIVTGFV